MDQSKYDSLVHSLGEMCVISASKKFHEIMMATFDAWARSEPRFKYDFEASDIVAKSVFMNDSSMFFSSVQGNVRNVTSPLTQPDAISTLASRGVLVNSKLEEFLSSIDSSKSDSGMVELRDRLASEIKNYFFPESTRSHFKVHPLLVDEIDFWISNIVAEVVVSSHFGYGSPADSEHAIFYRFVKDKDEHVVASILIGIAYIEFWISSASERNNIGDGGIDDD